jgi:DNA (cytosine-5)-methyltransferase 1
MLKTLDLFSGVGGFALAGEMIGGFQVTQFVEIDPSAQEVLADNFPGVPIHDDIRNFHANPGQFDCITAGFPCTDISCANPTGAGLDGERSGLFFEVIRLIRECRPRYVVLENVAALLSSNGGRDVGTVLWQLSEVGYDAEWQIISAAAAGANHLRERIWIVAYPNSNRRSRSFSIESNRDQGWLNQTCRQEWQAIGSQTKPNNVFCWPPRLSDISSVPMLDDGILSPLDKSSARKSRS